MEYQTRAIRHISPTAVNPIQSGASDGTVAAKRLVTNAAVLGLDRFVRSPVFKSMNGTGLAGKLDFTTVSWPQTFADLFHSQVNEVKAAHDFQRGINPWGRLE